MYRVKPEPNFAKCIAARAGQSGPSVQASASSPLGAVLFTVSETVAGIPRCHEDMWQASKVPSAT